MNDARDLLARSMKLHARVALEGQSERWGVQYLDLFREYQELLRAEEAMQNIRWRRDVIVWASLSIVVVLALCGLYCYRQ